MSTASVLRIRLAAATARPLRVRIKGGDPEIGNAGCYPVVVQMVATTPANYAIPLSAFHSPAWCGAKAVSIEQTLRSVERVEVTANDEPTGPVVFSVGPIDFLADDRSEPASSDDVEGVRESPTNSMRSRQRDEPAGASASAMATSARAPGPASAPAPRRRPAAGGQANAAPAATSSKRVVCEHSARYELMLCY